MATKILKTIVGIIVVCGLSTHVNAQSFLTNGLVAYYPFTGHANDASGYRNDGIVHGATLVADRTGNPNSAYAFDGLDDYITVADAPENDLANQSTLSFWAKHGPGYGTPGGGDVQMISKWGIGGAGNASYLIGCTDGRFYVATCDGAPRPSTSAWDTSVTPTNEWHHVVLTREGTGCSFYVDGMLRFSTNLMQPQASSYNLDFGKEGYGNYGHYRGILDDIRIYNLALTPAEVQELHAIESACFPHAAKATPTMVNGFVVGLTITDSGCGYGNAPVVKVLGGGGSGCTAAATINNGVVTGITITAAGSGYTSTPIVKIASPPFTPWVGIAVSKVMVTQHVVLGQNYVLESSTDLRNWGQVGGPFTAEDEVITQEFDVDVTGRFFRIRQVP